MFFEIDGDCLLLESCKSDLLSDIDTRAVMDGSLVGRELYMITYFLEEAINGEIPTEQQHPSRVQITDNTIDLGREIRSCAFFHT